MTWRRVMGVPPAGGFQSVPVTGRGRVIAVGGLGSGSRAVAVIAKWNGLGFVVQPTNAQPGWLFGVAGGARGGVWAVGQDPSAHPLLLHRTRLSGGWRPMTSPADSQASGYTSVVTTGGGDTAWVVGDSSVVERFNAGQWTVYPSLGTAASSITRLPGLPIVLMAGADQQGMSIWEYDQGSWHQVGPPPTLALDGGLAGIAAATAHRAEAVGTRQRPSSLPRMLALRGS